MARSIPLEKGCCVVAHGRTPADFVLQEGDELVILAESLDTLRIGNEIAEVRWHRVDALANWPPDSPAAVAVRDYLSG